MISSKWSWRKCLLILLVTMLAVGLTGFLCREAAADDLEDELSQVYKQIAGKEDDISDAEARIVDASEEVDAINEKLNAKQAEVDQLEAEIAEVNTEIGQAEADLEKNEKAMKKQLKILDDRLVDYYVNGKISYLQVLLEASSFSDLINRSQYIALIVKQDDKLIQEIDAEKEKIEKMKAELEDQRASLQELEDQKVAARDELQVQADAKSAVLAEVEEELNDYEAQLSELEEEAEAIAAEIAAAAKKSEESSSNSSSASAVSSGSGLLWPLPGYTELSSYFGYRVHPIYGEVLYHSGIDIPAPEGVSILAVDSGTVSYSGWNGGFGNCVMVDHGNGMVSLYGHMSAIYVSYGQTVAQGESVGAVGTTGTSTGNHLHLSIYVNGELVDPLNYY